MPVRRIYCPFPLARGLRTALAEVASNHVSRVLRLVEGDALVLFDGGGAEYSARIEAIGRKGVTVEVGEPCIVSRESPLDVTLAQGISAAERMDYTLQKAVELGVGAIQPLAAERSVVRLSGERAAKRVQHWRAVAVASCEQCGRNRVPEVAGIDDFSGWAARMGVNAAQKFMLSPNAKVRFHDLPAPAGAIILLAGPEGGFSSAERSLACAAGFVPVRLGPRVLRTETAALAALAAMNALWGDF